MGIKIDFSFDEINVVIDVPDEAGFAGTTRYKSDKVELILGKSVRKVGDSYVKLYRIRLKDINASITGCDEHQFAEPYNDDFMVSTGMTILCDAIATNPSALVEMINMVKRNSFQHGWNVKRDQIKAVLME
ncbi:MAG: hypothetical protein WC284_16880 [Candidimonas sp.]